MGSVTVADEQWYRLAFRPDMPVGNWGFAFDVELFINSEGDFSDRGWEFGNSTQTLARLYVIDTADLRNGGVFLEDRVEDIPSQVHTVFYEVPLAPLHSLHPPVRV